MILARRPCTNRLYMGLINSSNSNDVESHVLGHGHILFFLGGHVGVLSKEKDSRATRDGSGR